MSLEKFGNPFMKQSMLYMTYFYNEKMMLSYIKRFVMVYITTCGIGGVKRLYTL